MRPAGAAAPRLSRTRTLVFSVAVTLSFLVSILAACRICASWLGIRDPRFRYENRIGMWEADSSLAFRNKAHLDEYCFGTVRVATNEHGFRGRVSTARRPEPGTTRVIGVGDSVMWGTGVDQEDSFLGRLADQLEAARPGEFEVINAGVVGYSTLQEAVFLEQRLLEFSPDVVVVNFCANDMLPTEDPFGSARRMVVDYLTGLLQEPNGSLSPEEHGFVEETIVALRSADLVEPVIDDARPETHRVQVKALIEIPFRRMVELSRAAGVRLIVLLIPPRDAGPRYRELAGRVRRILESEGVETIDFEPLLHGDSRSADDERRTPVGASLRRTPLRDLVNLITLHGIERSHARLDYIDFMHPSKRGNEIIAREILLRLLAPLPAEGKPRI
jgi:lysophospholipase L1-like esterase